MTEMVKEINFMIMIKYKP